MGQSMIEFKVTDRKVRLEGRLVGGRQLEEIRAGESLEPSAQPARVHSGTPAPAGGVDAAITGMRLEDGKPLSLNLVTRSKMCL